MSEGNEGNKKMMDSTMRKIRVRHFEHHSHIIPIDNENEDSLKTPPLPSYVDLAYRVVGNGPEKVVFIAGMCVSHEMWQFQERSLRSHPMFSLLFIDNRGSGDSSSPTQSPLSSPTSSPTSSPSSSFSKRTDSESDSGPESEPEHIPECDNEKQLNGYTIEAMARDVWAVTDTVFGNVPVHLIGHSMGSMIVQRAALSKTYGHRLTSLSLLCGHDGGWFWNMTPSMSLLKAALFFGLACNFNNSIMQADAYLSIHFTSEFTLRNRTKLRKRYINGMNDPIAATGCASAWDHYTAVRSHNLSPQDALTLRDRPYPKLVIYGTYDTVVMPRASRQLAGRIGAKAIPVQAAHFAMEEAADDINQLLVNHIAEAGLIRHLLLAKANTAAFVKIGTHQQQNHYHQFNLSKPEQQAVDKH